MPLNWNPSRVFYGWWIVGASFLIAVYVGGVVFYGFTAFFEPIADEMGWSYTQISLAASLRGLETGFFAPIIGILADRWGSRRLIFSGALITAAGLMLLSTSNSLSTFYISFAFIALGMSASTATVLMTAVANWFRKRIGLASGIAICGFGVGGLLVPLINRLIVTYDWRMTVTILAAGMLTVVLPLSLVFRHKPEDYGYLTDGKREGKQSGDSTRRPVTQKDIKAGQALRSGTFWRLAIASIYNVLVVSAVVTHVMPYLSTIRLSRSLSSLVAAAIPLTSVFGRLGLGWLGDKFGGKIIAAGSCIAIGLGLISFGYTATARTWVFSLLLILFLILFSVGYGGFAALRPAIARQYFGRSQFGVIFGFLIGIGWLGGVIGPTLTGWIYDTWGNYQISWFLIGGLSVVPLIALLTMVPIKDSTESAESP